MLASTVFFVSPDTSQMFAFSKKSNKFVLALKLFRIFAAQMVPERLRP